MCSSDLQRIVDDRSEVVRWVTVGADDVRFQTDVIGDPIIVRADGHPAYNFAAVVDDALMEVTHVVRGEDHISNTPRQLLLYEAFGWQPPQFAHVGLLQDQSHQKLSKRNGDMLKDISTFRERMGIFPETLTNFVALLGWSHTKRKDAMTLDDLVNNVCFHQSFVFASA